MSRWLVCENLLAQPYQHQWRQHAAIELDNNGKILSVGAAVPAGAKAETISGWVIPGFTNAHSHAFQYAMAGMAECLKPGSDAGGDDFWQWRDRMYKLALNISPKQLGAVARTVYAEMLRLGYTWVVEFHYIHHDPDGKPYENRAEMSEVLLNAAGDVGMGITLAPVFYNRGNFSAAPLPEQRRFISKSVEEYQKLFDDCAKAVKRYAHAKLAVSVHSLRAATPEQVVQILRSAPKDTPRHMHIAEQAREVEYAKKHLGARPVQWLCDSLPVDGSYNLVHSTHLDPREIKTLAQTEATVVLCPSTEGNLGDGFFQLREFCRAGGAFTIGSDSNVGLNPAEELRWLDYSQRLSDQKRNVICTAGDDESGQKFYATAVKRGLMSAGLTAEPFAVGQSCQFIALDGTHPVLAGKPAHKILSSYIYAGDSTILNGTFSQNRWVVRDGRHEQREKLFSAFAAFAQS